MIATFATNFPFPHLWNYLCHTTLVSTAQFFLLALIVHLVVTRSLRKLSWVCQPLPGAEPVANDFVQALTQLNVGLGLLLTFSGVYGLIGAGGGDGIGDGIGDGNWPLLLALGSSALGYSSYAVCAVGAIVDGWGRRDFPPGPGGAR